MDTKGGKWWWWGGCGGGVMNWEIGIDIYTLICIKWITSKNLMYKKINKTQKKKKKRNRAGPCGAPGHKSLFVSPVFLLVGNRLHSASVTFPEFQRAGSNSC